MVVWKCSEVRKCDAFFGVVETKYDDIYAENNYENLELEEPIQPELEDEIVDEEEEAKKRSEAFKMEKAKLRESTAAFTNAR